MTIQATAMAQAVWLRATYAADIMGPKSPYRPCTRMNVIPTESTQPVSTTAYNTQHTDFPLLLDVPVLLPGSRNLASF